jgi:hypothetical protein
VSHCSTSKTVDCRILEERHDWTDERPTESDQDLLYEIPASRGHAVKARLSNCVSRGYNHKPLQSRFCRFEGFLNPTSRRMQRTRDLVRNRSR